MKKIIAILLSLMMIMVILTGCGGASNEAKENAGEATETSGDDVSKEPDHIIVTYLTMGTTPKDLLRIQEAVNEITIPEINVEVEFKPIAIGDTFSTYSIWIAGGDQIDLMMLAFQDPSTYIGSGSIENLDDLIAEYAPTIAELSKVYPIYDGGKKGGSVYAVSPLRSSYGQQGNLMMRKDWFEETGFPEKDIYTLDDLTEIFAAIKEKHPNAYPYGALGGDISPSTNLYSYLSVIDTLGAGLGSGVLMSPDSTEIVNLFETEEYYNFIKKTKEWYDAGYIMKDAATTDQTMIELTTAEVIASANCVYSPERFANYEQGFATFGGAVALRTTEIFKPSESGTSGTFWTIPVTSANPAAAMKFLNYLYENYDLMNLIQWGIEGEHYVKTDKEGIITFPDGIDASTSGYYNTLGLWGDMRELYAWSDASNREANDKFTNEAFKNKTKASGYSYDSSNMIVQLVAIDSVLEQYLPALETGSVSDLDGTYQKFLSALEVAGIYDVIADNQAQFDAWLAEQ